MILKTIGAGLRVQRDSGAAQTRKCHHHSARGQLSLDLLHHLLHHLGVRHLRPHRLLGGRPGHGHGHDVAPQPEASL